MTYIIGVEGDERVEINCEEGEGTRERRGSKRREHRGREVESGGGEGHVREREVREEDRLVEMDFKRKLL